MAMEKEFTVRARRVMELAGLQARFLRHKEIGTEHILLGLLEEGTGVAFCALMSIRITFTDAQYVVTNLLGAGSEEVTELELPLNSQAKKTLKCACDEARSLGHEFVGTEHLLLGMLHVEGCVALQVLKSLGCDLEDCRQVVKEVLAELAGPPL